MTLLIGPHDPVAGVGAREGSACGQGTTLTHLMYTCDCLMAVARTAADSSQQPVGSYDILFPHAGRRYSGGRRFSSSLRVVGISYLAKS